MGVLLGFTPWLVYWVLVGNVPPPVAAGLALATAVAVMVAGRKSPARPLGVGGIATFSVLAVLPLASGGAHRWLLSLSFAGLFAVLLIRSAVGDSVAAAVVTTNLGVPVAQSELISPLVHRLTWIWLGSLTAMTVSAGIPAIAQSGGSALPNTDSPLLYVCCWVIPFGILAAAAVASHITAVRMTAGLGEAVRKSSFVAFVDLEIDQLYYLATEHANREVGPGQEAYMVTVGTKGTPLVGDGTRVSWPSTYKVRQRRS